jgi:hypothetical protein
MVALIMLSTVAVADYVQFIGSNNDTNAPDGALGGNPTVDDADTVNPTLSGPVNISGTNCMAYVYRRRLDAAARGLAYGLVLIPAI